MLPGVNYGQIFNLSFGNTTLSSHYLHFNIRPEQRPHLDVSVARTRQLVCGKSPYIYRGFLRKVLAISPLFRWRFSLWSSSDLWGNHGCSGLKKETDRLRCLIVLFLPRWRLVQSDDTNQLRFLWRLWRFTRMRQELRSPTRNIWWLEFSRTRALYRDVSLRLRTVWEWIYQTWKTKTPLEALPAKSKRETATVFIFMESFIMGVTRTSSEDS